MTIDPVAKILIAAGAALILIGIAWQFGWIQSLRLGRLPGDISIQRENFSFYFPLTTCLILSGLLAVLNWIFRG